MNYLVEHCRNQVVPKLDNAIQCKKNTLYFWYFYEDFLDAPSNF